MEEVELAGLVGWQRGQGPRVVFVHGTPSSSLEFFDAMTALDDCHTVSVDHLGFGASPKPVDGDYSMAAHQARFAAAMDALPPAPAVFVLHDFGLGFALPWMLANPEKVRGVVLMNTFAWPATGWIRWILAFYATPLGRWIYRRFNLSAGVLLPWAWGTRRPLTKEVHATFLAPFARPEDRYGTSSLVSELLGDRWAELDLDRLAQWPVRAVWGMADPLVGPDALELWRRRLPELPVTEVANAGHFVAYEAPDEVVAAVRSLAEDTRDDATRAQCSPDVVGASPLRS